MKRVILALVKRAYNLRLEAQTLTLFDALAGDIPRNARDHRQLAASPNLRYPPAPLGTAA